MGTGKLLIVGANGMLGADMLGLLSGSREVAGTDYPEIDITDRQSVEDSLSRFKPNVLVNCAAYTDVDGCERNPDLAFKVNAEGAGILAECCRDRSISMVHISTDFVFDGLKGEPYTEEDTPNPISKYAESKLAGEERIKSALDDHVIVRSTWLFGFNDKSFVRFVIRMAEKGGKVPVFSSQRACPTYTIDLAEGIANLIDHSAKGTYNVVNGSDCNRLEFVEEIFDIMGYDKSRIELMDKAPSSWVAKRPVTSILSTGKYTRLTGERMRTWQEALRSHLGETRK